MNITAPMHLFAFSLIAFFHVGATDLCLMITVKIICLGHWEGVGNSRALTNTAKHLFAF